MRLAVWRAPVAAALLLAAAAADAVQTGDPLVLPNPIALPPNVDRGLVARALSVALERRGWTVVADTGESMTVRLPTRPKHLRLRLHYADGAIAFLFLDDTHHTHASYEAHFLIHPRANAIFQDVGDEVRLQLRVLASERERARVVPLAADAPLRSSRKVQRIQWLKRR